MRPDPSSDRATAPAGERGAALALLPIAATLDFYILPSEWQADPLVQFAPQILAYLALALWATHNRPILPRLGLEPRKLSSGLRLGLLIGLLLGSLNTAVLLKILPALGYDITFLKDTPHARIPLLVMVPWFICGIAAFVEINFRGFLLGRLAALKSNWLSALPARRTRSFTPLALLISALTFSFDPFMVATFRQLHWIAVWDGLIWGAIWLRTRNLYATVIAHAVEVIVMYLAVRTALG
jgi:membrane protease YdiL (CAAX protease family)